MSNNKTPHSKYDVFVSFRGEDIRHDFLSHLVKAFPRKQINAFVDDKLKRGDDISDSLVEAIEGSSISLVIFSENYDSSRWCLDELVKIIDCKEKYGQIVIPVFYGVDPTNVRHQKKSYEFAELEKRYELSEVQIWRHALQKSANLSGIKSLDFQNDAELVEEITKVVLMRLSKLKNSPVNSKKLVGIDKPIAHLKSLLKKESHKAPVIGIWGMGGIGKTTIAKESFDQICSEYDGCCFLEKVSEELKRHGIESLRKKLFSKLLSEDVNIDTPNRLPSLIERQIRHMKVLIILDDVKGTDQLKELFGSRDWFRSDSRIILTARDKQVLIANEVDDDDLYKVGVLDSSEALALFNLNAFKQSHPEMEYYELSKRLIEYARGIPLNLKVLARMLRGKTKEVWESQLNKLKRQPVNYVMRLSYDDLDHLEQKYFLDIACFFNGLNLKVDYMKLLLRDSDSDDSVAVVLARLEDKALITISEDNVLSMHDILQEMGREVVRQESSEHPEKRSRLWDPDFIHDALKNDKLKGVAENAMSNNTRHAKYDVFVSFRGEIRIHFLSHLTKAFPGKQINAFVDDKLKRGDDISHSLVEAIEGSPISLVIFSENYASSHWCLEELAKIIECKEKYGQIVIPVFYGVDPTDVRHQKKSYENAFVEFEKKYSSKVQIWRHALNTSANLSGIVSSSFKNDVELLEEIIKQVKHVLMSLSKHLVSSKGLIGINKPIAHLKSLLQKESKELRVIGIWGMGGIGKTTIAEEIFNQIYSEYDGCCLLKNVSEKLTRHGMESIEEKLFSTLLNEPVKELSNEVKRRIGRMKVLIVLDDIKDTNQLEMLFGTLDWFRSDSRIIVTTRDRQVLIANEVDDNDLYEVGVLDSSEALALFNVNAFKQSHLQTEFYYLSKRVVNYAKGVPLVLKVLAHMLRGKSKEVWESLLDKLLKLPIQKVHDVMRLSYDDLDRLERKYFLDIACFFNGFSLKVDYMKLLLKDCESDKFVVVGLERLKDKALITISEDSVISMHDILQEMGREVVRLESIEDPRKCSRLWDPDIIYGLLKNDKGTDAIRSISLDLSAIRKLTLSPRVFAKMTNLQFLDFHGGNNQECSDHGGNNQECSDLFPRGLQSFPTDLRYLSWKNYPLKSLPEKFSAENLVILDLPGSLLEKLWCGVQDLVNLKEVTLSDSEFLKELPDFTKATNLKVLNIQRCFKLKSVHPSIFSLNELVQLDLLSCPINALPSSFFECQSKLEVLGLNDTDIKIIPSSIKNLTRLRKLEIQRCSELVALPELPSSLETLLVDGCTSLKNVLFPSTVAEQFKENKKKIRFWNCFKLDERSLINIGLNVQINLLKFTHQHLSTLEHDDYVESCVGYKDNFDSYEAYQYDFESYEALYVYPGSSVPEWLEYKTTKDNMIIDLSQPHLSHLLGFVFVKDFNFNDGIKLKITTFEGDDEKDGVHTYLRRPLCFKSDQVCMIYDQQCSQYLTRIAKNQTSFKIKVRARTNGIDKDQVCIDKYEQREVKLLKGIGISPINHSTNGIRMC